ncbi:UDP-glycosyltransferase 75C1-like [Coffea arabica]|uniref:Glycosyltransferase n=1 Tax=Coffea arabica TaxID=13443 RepID=A0A6P6WPX4_COFAR|nr:UDP-glycosyltransferase 75C1-like [Coffea arabica]
MNIKHQHFLITALPAQGHINPTLQLAKNLARAGAQVTFATTVYGISRIKNPPASIGLSFASFSDGYDDAESMKNRDFACFLSDVKCFGSKDLTKFIQASSNEGRPVTFAIYTVLLPWVAEVASEMNIHSALLAIQCATSFAIYHRYFNSHDGIYDEIREVDCSSISIKLPDLSLFQKEDLPTFLLPNDPFFASIVPFVHENIKILEQDSKACVLVNTFNELEEASIKAVHGMNLIPIGPLIPSAFCDGYDSSDKSVGGNLFDIPENDCLQWLDSKPERSVVYASFGSLLSLKKQGKMEILHGLKEAGRSYLLVLRADNEQEEDVKAVVENISSEEGMIVPWCSQMEVLCHRSIGCFLTHCGWNSTLESIVAGVPIVGCPHLSDQTTNAKLIEEVWGIGVRAKANEEGVVERAEIRRCLDIVMGGDERGEEIRRNSAKWSCMAIEAVKENGSSHNNFRNFLQNLE